MLQDPELPVLLSYKAQNEEAQIQSGMELYTKAETNNLLKMGIFCHGLVTKKTYSGIPDFVGVSSHVISCAFLPQVVFKIFSTN